MYLPDRGGEDLLEFLGEVESLSLEFVDEFPMFECASVGKGSCASMTEEKC